MKFFSILFLLALFFSVSSYAQSQDKKGCGKESECVVKTCEDEGTEVKAQVKSEANQKQAVKQQTKEAQQTGQQSATAKPVHAKKEK